MLISRLHAALEPAATSRPALFFGMTMWIALTRRVEATH